MKLLLDTNVLVYDTVEDSEHHNEAVGIIDKAEEIILPSIVIHEYVWVMLKVIQASPSFIILKLHEYLEDPRTIYLLEPVSVLTSALKMLEEDREEVKEVNDYVVLAVATYCKSMLATFDRKLQERALRRGLKVIP